MATKKTTSTKKPAAKAKGGTKRHAPDLDTNGYSMAKVKGRTEAVLTKAAKERRQMFALAYVQCGFNGRKAAAMIGCPPASARKQASEMCAEPYTQELIEKLKLELLADMTRMGNIAKLGMLREAHYEGMGSSHSARVSAFAHVGRWYGLDKQDNGENTLAPSGVMEIPLAGNMEEWTQASTTSQSKLMADVRK